MMSASTATPATPIVTTVGVPSDAAATAAASCTSQLGPENPLHSTPKGTRDVHGEAKCHQQAVSVRSFQVYSRAVGLKPMKIEQPDREHPSLTHRYQTFPQVA